MLVICGGLGGGLVVVLVLRWGVCIFYRFCGGLCLGWRAGLVCFWYFALSVVGWWWVRVVVLIASVGVIDFVLVCSFIDVIC